jgi:hypothetical protein
VCVEPLWNGSRCLPRSVNLRCASGGVLRGFPIVAVRRAEMRPGAGRLMWLPTIRRNRGPDHGRGSGSGRKRRCVEIGTVGIRGTDMRCTDMRCTDMRGECHGVSRVWHKTVTRAPSRARSRVDRCEAIRLGRPAFSGCSSWSAEIPVSKSRLSMARRAFSRSSRLIW